MLLDLLRGAYAMDDVQWPHVEAAFICIGLFVVGVWGGAFLRKWTVPRGIISIVSQEFPVNTYFGLAVTAFVLGMLTFAIPSNFNLVLMFSALGQGRWSAPWGRGQLGGWDAFTDQLQYFGYLLPALTVIIAQLVGWVNKRTIASLGMSVLMMIFIAQSGSRRIIGVMIGMAIVLWILTQKELCTRHIVTSIILAASLLLTMELMLEYRNIGFAVLSEQKEYDPLLEEKTVRVDDNFYRLCQIIQLIPEYYPHTYGQYIVWVAVRPVPRVFWPGKPVDPGFDLPDALGRKGVSYSSSVIGELYMAGGFIGVILGGLFYGSIAGMAIKLLTQSTTFGVIILYSTLTMALFLGMRSMLELVLMNYATLAWIGMSQLFVIWQKSRNSSAVKTPEKSVLR